MGDYVTGQIFLDDYPEDAAAWCNENGLLITEIEPEDGHRRFQIQEVPEPTPEEREAEEERRRNSPEARLADIEDALVELAELIAGGE